MLDKMNVAHTEADTHACNVQSRKRRKDRACGRPAARPAHLFFPKGRKQERKPNERRALAREHKGIILATMKSHDDTDTLFIFLPFATTSIANRESRAGHEHAAWEPRGRSSRAQRNGKCASVHARHPEGHGAPFGEQPIASDHEAGRARESSERRHAVGAVPANDDQRCGRTRAPPRDGTSEPVGCNVHASTSHYPMDHCPT